MFYDITYLILIPALLFAFYAQSKVTLTYAKYAKVASSKGYTGADVARQLLRISGITDVNVTNVAGELTDHFDPRTKVIRLSDAVFDKTSVAALAVAAHETGHAIQHNVGYVPLSIRSAVSPVLSFGSQVAPFLFMIGLIFNFTTFMQLGIVFFFLYFLFSVITLPVEFNASSRAIALLESNNFLTETEVKPAKKVLNAAAMTYIASALMALLQLIRFIFLSRSRDD